MATQHKEIDAQTLENLLYLSRLSPESTNMETLKKQVDDIVGYFDILSKYDDSENPYDAYPRTEADKLRGDTVVDGLEISKIVLNEISQSTIYIGLCKKKIFLHSLF